MAIEVLFFGSLVDITATPKLIIQDLPDSAAVVEYLEYEFPALKNSTYFTTVNKQIIHKHQAINEGDCIALMPPFSGG
jgi:molybdopterin converting factor small subunit